MHAAPLGASKPRAAHGQCQERQADGLLEPAVASVRVNPEDHFDPVIPDQRDHKQQRRRRAEHDLTIEPHRPKRSARRVPCAHMPEPKPFALQVEQAVLEDLRSRLERARWPDEPPDATDWKYGTDLTYLKELVDYWRTGFDWRKQEAALNAFPQYTVPVAGIELHFLHVPGVGPNPTPLLLSHGWPGSVWEFHKIIPMLTDPARFGGVPDDAFTVVAPSLPGYTLSFKPGQ